MQHSKELPVAFAVRCACLQNLPTDRHRFEARRDSMRDVIKIGVRSKYSPFADEPRRKSILPELRSVKKQFLMS